VESFFACLFVLTGPLQVLYDFACQLSDYCVSFFSPPSSVHRNYHLSFSPATQLNRWGEVFDVITFLHDKFHLMTHKCGKAHDFERLNMSHGANTSIMEQQNAKLARIKDCLRGLGPVRYFFYLQTYIYYLNKQCDVTRKRMRESQTSA
jgi:hypothetical protein